MSDVLGLLATLSPEKRLLLLERNPLSFAQERFWFLERLEPGRSGYHMPMAVELAGDLDLAALEEALFHVVERHQVLRSTFPEVDGRPLVSVQPAKRPAFPRLDLSAIPAAERPAAGREAFRRFVGKPFDLAARPPWRAAVVRLERRRHLLFMNVHHMLADGHALNVLLQELVLATNGEPLPALPIQYVDFARWQRRALRGEALERHIEYWRQQLAGAPTALELPTDRRRPAVASHRGAAVHGALPHGMPAAVHRLARECGASPFMVLLAVFQLVLGRFSGSDDIVVGTPVSGRPRVETESLIGLFLNTLPLRVNLSGMPGFRSLLAQVRQVVLAAFDHQQLPFEKLVAELSPERDLSRHPIFQVMFTLVQGRIAGSTALAGASLLPWAAQGSLAVNYDLNFEVDERADGMRLHLAYNADLFDAVTAERLLGHYLRVLADILERPDMPVPPGIALPAGEAHLLQWEWNDTGSPEPSERLLPELFLAEAGCRPDAVAVTSGDVHLVYGEVARRSAGLARRLRRLDVGPEVRVAVALERSAELPGVLLGVLLAGGAYLPLDLAFPGRRLAAMVADAEPALVVTTPGSAEERLVAALGAATPPRVLLQEGPEAAGACREESPAGISSASLAYLLYTSGSTGRPKGVAVAHGSLSRFLLAMAERPGLGRDDVLVAVTTLSFDIAALELFLPLVVGARVVVAGPGEASDGERLAGLLERAGATALQATPASWRILFASGWRGSRRLLALCGGEALPPELAAELGEHCRELWNVYGPTEATVWATAERVAASADAATGPVPIGRPIAGTTAYILDRDRRLSPIGVPGEVHLGGTGVARGYWGRPGETALRFVPDPQGGMPGARLYATGDLGRRLADGRLEFLGRIDQQVKLRGYRIELGEIESFLARYPGVRESVVAVVRDGRGQDLLVAYVVPDPAAPPAAEALRAHLAEELPDYMIPARTILLAELPLTPSGKIDRKALPSPSLAGADPEAAAGLQGPVEEIVASAWEEVLGIAGVRAGDHFFELGGHSLFATQVASRLRLALGVEVPVALLFENPVLEHLARRLESLRERADGTVEMPEPGPAAEGADQPAPLSFAQERLWFMAQLEPDDDALHLSRALRLAGPLVVAALEAAIAGLILRHEALRTVFPDVDGQPVQRILPACRRARLPRVDLTPLGPEGARREAEKQLAAGDRRPFDLARGPLLRLALIRLGDQDHVLGATLHHIIADLWSMGVFARDLGALFRAALAGLPSPLPDLPLQVRDFARWERRWLTEERLERELAYWERQLSSAPDLTLPSETALARGGARAGRLEVAVAAPVLAGLRAVARAEGASLFMVLLAAYQATLSLWTGDREIVVGAPVAGRRHRGTEGLIGFFLNSLPLRTDLSGNPSLRELILRVRALCLEVYSHQQVPFQRLVERFGSQRGAARPFFRAWLTLQNAPLAPLALSPVEVAPFATGAAHSPFDLALLLQQAGEGLVGLFEYRADKLSRATAAGVVERFGKLLEMVAERPGTTLEEAADRFASQDRSRLRDRAESGLRGLRRRSAESVLLEVG